MISVYSLIANNYVDNVTTAVQELTGKKPTALTEVLQRDFAETKR